MTEPKPSPLHCKRPWALTVFCLAAIAGLISMPLVAGNAGEDELPEIIRFLGRFHPFVLHLPIGVFTLILFQELGALFSRKQRQAVSGSIFPLFFGAASAIVAVIAGFLLYHSNGSEYGGNDLAERHLWGGLAFAVAAILTFLVKAWTAARGGNSASYRIMLFGSFAVMGFTSHDGASITHGRDYLTQYAPDPIRKILGLEPRKHAGSRSSSADPVVYNDVIAPILERRCVQCHKEGKAKGKLRMDTFEMLLAGGKEGPAVEAGDSAKSPIVIRMELPEDDDEHMPPEGKPDVSDHELAVIKWWIDSGADAQMKVSEHQDIPDEIQQALAEIRSMPAEEPEPSAPKPVDRDPALVSAVNELAKEFPGAISFESQQSNLVHFTAASMRGNLDDKTFAKLTPVLPQLVSVDLTATEITDQSVATLTAATQLRRIRLAETPVTDASIDTLLKLPQLESINLFGSKVTDSGIRKLAALPNLKNLYLWQTPATPETIQMLKEKLPDCQIVTGS